MNTEPMQKIILQLGKTGCYLFCLVIAAAKMTGKIVDIFQLYIYCLGKKWLDDKIYLEKPEAIFGYLVGGEWLARKEPITYTPVAGEIVILRYEWQDDDDLKGHFCLGNINKIIEYDPMGKSLTVQNGKLVSLRILARVA